MFTKALNVAVIPRARRRRALLAGLAGVCITGTATLAGTMLLNSPPGPMLTAVSDYQLPNDSLAQHAPELSRDAEAAADPTPAVAPQPEDVSADSDVQWFNNRPVRPVATMSMLVTAYSPDERSCGKWADGITASGYSVWTNGMKLVASDNAVLPLGSLVSIPGYDNGAVVPVLDRGGAIKGNRLDVLYPTHEQALQWGVQRLEVTVWEYADGKPNDFRQRH